MAIYAVDFDGTLAVTRFPEIVEPKRKTWKRRWNGATARA